MSKVLGLFARVNHWEVESWPKWSDAYISYFTSIELNQVKMNMFNTEIVSNCGHCHVSRWSASFSSGAHFIGLWSTSLCSVVLLVSLFIFIRHSSGSNHFAFSLFFRFDWFDCSFATYFILSSMYFE